MGVRPSPFAPTVVQPARLPWSVLLSYFSAAKVDRWEYIVSTIGIEEFKMPTTQSARSRRINLRASAPQETLIRAGAKVRGVNMTDFILESACTRAEQIIADQTTFTLSPQQWKAFSEALDRPPMAKAKPRLQKLFSEKTVLER